MKDLIEALTIFLTYGNPYNPTHCEHDELFVCISPDMVSAGDIARLDKLGFRPSEGVFRSYRFGSA